MASFGLFGVINFPTRISGFSHTLIDNFLYTQLDIKFLSTY
jgi:hypothetical protein